MSVIDLSSTDIGEGPRTVEACIIGSGCGGATAARILAEAGHDVLVLEEGGDRTGTALTQRGPAMYDQLYMDRGGRATHDLTVAVMQGRALGGGGVINACDVVPIPSGVLDHWQNRWGLTGFTREALEPHRDAALADLSANPITSEQVNRANALLRDGTKGMGWRGELMMHNRQGCQGLGTCLIGCPINAKRNPRFVSIPAAIAAGAQFWTRARAVRLENANAEIKTVRLRALDSDGRREQREIEVRAKIVILAANAVCSAQLLLRSGIGNQHVGRHLSLQPQLPVVAVFKEPVLAFDGIPQAWAVTEFEREHDDQHGLWGFRIEAVMGTPGIVSALLPSMGAEGMRLMKLYDHLAASLLLCPDLPSGVISLSSDGRPVVTYALDDEQRSRFRRAIVAAAKIYLQAGASEVVVPVQPPLTIRSLSDLVKVDDITFAPATAPFISAHQQGGLRFSPNRDGGATAPDGAVYGTRDVYAFDSSGYPSSASSHTMAPIITTSRFLTTQLLVKLA